MIRTIGGVYQDATSFGFLKGLQARLGCSADIIPPIAPMGRTRHLTRRQARIAWEYFAKKGADVIVRLTDADRTPWREVVQREEEAFPAEAKPLLICAAAVENIEDWLALDLPHLAKALSIDLNELADPAHRTGRIKRGLAMARSANEGKSDVVARLISQAPQDVFRRWLQDESLRRFYQDCRAAAAQHDCPVPNEL